MINQLLLKNFKSAKNLRIEKIKRVTLIGGKNNTGKSTILESMFLVLDRFNPQLFLRQLNWRGTTIIRSEVDNIFAPFFYNYDLANKIEISIHDNEMFEISYEKDVLPQEVNISKDLTGASAQTNMFNSGAIRFRFIQNHTVLDESIMDLEKYSQLKKQSSPCPGVCLASRIKYNPSEDAERFGKVEIQGLKKEVIKVLNILEPKIDDLSVVTFQKESMIYAGIGLGKKIPIVLLGDGLTRLLSIVLAIINIPNGVLFIDEIENGIHHSQFPAIWEAILQIINKYNCQLIVTTHSYEALKSIHEIVLKKEFYDFNYIRLDKSEGEIKPNLFNYEMFKSAIEKNIELR